MGLLDRSLSMLAALLLIIEPTFALEGQIATHDPSTVAMCDGKYYVLSTGRNIPFMVSDDGFNWRRGGSLLDKIPETVRQYSPKNNGTGVWAPDVIKVNGQYYVYYSVSSWGDFASAVGLVTGPTLDPESPDFKWTDRGPVVWSDGKEDLNAIDPGVFHDPNDGTLWIVYGSYHGTCRLLQLDPKTGLRLDADKPATVVASRSEAADLIYHDGWYYLLTNHGSCCSGANSTYNIRVGRSKTVTGPYLDSHGDEMADGGGDLFAAAGDRKIGPGHFGLLDLGDGVQKFSCHYECDLDYGGFSTLDIRPLLWRDGWPVAGDNLKSGTYQIRNQRTGTNIELAVPGAPVVERRGRGSGGGGGGGATRPTSRPAIAISLSSTRPTTWPTSPQRVRMAPYLLQDQQRWTITPVKDAGGTPGSAFVKITIETTDRAMQVGDDGAIASDTFTGADNQLWRIDQLTDGGYRIMSKSGKGALLAGERNRLSLSEFHADDDRQKWLITAP